MLWVSGLHCAGRVATHVHVESLATVSDVEASVEVPCQDNSLNDRIARGARPAAAAAALAPSAHRS